MHIAPLHRWHAALLRVWHDIRVRIGLYCRRNSVRDNLRQHRDGRDELRRLRHGLQSPERNAEVRGVGMRGVYLHSALQRL